MIAGGELNKKQLAELRKALASMELPPRKRQRLIWRLAQIWRDCCGKTACAQSGIPGWPEVVGT